MSSGVKRLKENIIRGKLGKNIGIPTGVLKLDSVIYGIQRKYLYTIGADTSGGKTSFAIDIFVYNLIKNSKGVELAILYYSFEMSSDVLYAKLLSLYIWDTFEEIVTYEDILSLTTKISKEHEELVNKSMPWLDKISKHLTIYDKALAPNGIYGSCKEWLRKYGEFSDLDEHRETYTDNNPDMYKVVLIDHVGLISGQETKKTKIDLVSDYMIYFRNKCSITGVFIQQLNRNTKSMDRKLNGYELIQLDDFKDSSSTTDASEVVIGLYYPYREKIARCEGYPISSDLKNRFRLCQIIKNRYGRADLSMGLVFYGEISMFNGLPKPEEISDYSYYNTLEGYSELLSKEDNENNLDKEKKKEDKVDMYENLKL